MNTPGKDYTHHSWLAAAALIAVLVAVSFIPPQSVGGVKLRRANILSDLLSFDDAEAAEPAAEPALFDEEEFHIDMAAVAERIEAGNCWVNTHFELDPRVPFGGHKESGIGTEWGVGGLISYCNSQTLYLKT